MQLQCYQRHGNFALHYMGLVARKPSFGVPDQASFKPVFSATETKLDNWNFTCSSLHIILSKKRITKALIRLRGCAGTSAPVLFANPPKTGFPVRGPIIIWSKMKWHWGLNISLSFIHMDNVLHGNKVWKIELRRGHFLVTKWMMILLNCVEIV